MTFLDSNILIHCLKGKEPVSSRFRSASPSTVAIPSVVAYELEYGTLRIADPGRRGIFDAMLRRLTDVPFDREAAIETARIRLGLERLGVVIGPMDLLIAGTALSRGAVLATNNTDEFSRVPGLRLEDWTLPGRAS